MSDRRNAARIVLLLVTAALAAIVLAWVFLEAPERGTVEDATLDSALRVPPVEEVGATLEKESASIPVRAAEEVAPRARPQVASAPADDEVARWEGGTAGLSPADLEELASSLEAEVSNQAARELKVRQEAGMYDEVVGHGQTFHPTRDQRRLMDDELACYAIPGIGEPNGEIRKTKLPPKEFPELYSMKRNAKWLRQRVAELRTKK